MKKILLTFMGACLLLAPAGCVDQINLSNLGGAAADLHTAATLDDAELKEMCVQMRKKGDAEARVASANSKYAIRLKKIMGKHTSVNGTCILPMTSMPMPPLTVPCASIPVSWT